MLEVSEIASLVQEQADDQAILIFGAAVNEDMEDEIAITVIATGFSEGADSKIDYSSFDNKVPRKVVTDEGLEGTETTLEKLFEEHEDDEEDDSKFDIPTFLSN